MAGFPHAHRHPFSWGLLANPQEPVEIDPGHPLARGLMRFFLFSQRGGQVFDLVHRDVFSLGASTHRFETGPFGVALKLNDSARIQQPFIESSPAAPLTIACRGRPSVTEGRQVGSVVLRKNGTAAFWGLSWKNKATTWYALRAFDGAASQGLAVFQPPDADVMGEVTHTVAGVSRADNDHELFVDGESRATSTLTNDFGANPLDEIEISSDVMQSGDLTSYDWIGFWTRALDAHEAALLHAEPWAMLRPMRPRLFVSPAGGGVFEEGIGFPAQAGMVSGGGFLIEGEMALGGRAGGPVSAALGVSGSAAFGARPGIAPASMIRFDADLPLAGQAGFAPAAQAAFSAGVSFSASVDLEGPGALSLENALLFAARAAVETLSEIGTEATVRDRIVLSGERSAVVVLSGSETGPSVDGNVIIKITLSGKLGD